MTIHPSLRAVFSPPKQLEPQLKMGRNEPCWCRSGKKWKLCHLDRHLQTPVDVFKTIAAMQDVDARGYCSHPEAGSATCSGQIIRSHTVQRRRGLAALAEDGHVISIKAAFENIFRNQGAIVPSEVGVRSASTFMGFCNRHDTEMFRPIETEPVAITAQTGFLLSFRALAYEYFTKRSAIRKLEIQRESDKGEPFETQVRIQEYSNVYEQGLGLGMADLERWKAEYDEAFLKQRFDAFRFYCVGFSDTLPIVGCGAFHPEFDFEGRPLQKLGRGPATFEHVTYNLTVLNGRSLAVLGWYEGDNGPAATFAMSFVNVPAIEKAEAIIRLAFEHIENIYLKPSWWHELTDATKEATIRRIRTGIGPYGFERQPNCLAPDEHCYASGVGILEETQI